MYINHVTLFSNKKILTTDSTNMNESQNHNSQKKKRVHTVWSHLYKFLEQAILIYNENADQQSPGLGVVGTDGKKAQRDFWGWQRCSSHLSGFEDIVGISFTLSLAEYLMSCRNGTERYSTYWQLSEQINRSGKLRGKDRNQPKFIFLINCNLHTTTAPILS